MSAVRNIYFHIDTAAGITLAGLYLFRYPAVFRRFHVINDLSLYKQTWSAGQLLLGILLRGSFQVFFSERVVIFFHGIFSGVIIRGCCFLGGYFLGARLFSWDIFRVRGYFHGLFSGVFPTLLVLCRVELLLNIAKATSQLSYKDHNLAITQLESMFVLLPLLLLLGFRHSAANVIGIDVGSDTMKVGIVSPGAPLEIGNQASLLYLSDSFSFELSVKA